MDDYKGLISIMCNKVGINEVLNELRLFVDGESICLTTRSSNVFKIGNLDKAVSTLKRLRYDIQFDVDYTRFNIEPFVQVIEGVLGVDSEADDFLVTMSHEIRNPLHGVTGYTQLLQHTNLDKEQTTLLKSLTDCSLQLMQIINDVLDVSRLSSGHMQIQEECFLFSDLQDQVTSIISQRISNKKQTLVWRRASDIPSYIISDKQRIVQILINLISNAHKFSDKGSTIQVVFSVKSRGILAFQVIDDGVGIPVDKCDRLFKPFSQLSSSSAEEPGSGLGLAICKSLSMLMGGDVNVTSVVGSGSVFSVEVGFETVEDDDVSYGLHVAPSIAGKTILVISDVIDVRMSLMKLFGEVDITCVSFSTIEEAIYVIKQKSYELDIVLIQDSMGQEFEDNVQHLIPLVPLIIVGKKTCAVSKLQGQIDVPICRTQVMERVEEVIRLHVINDMNAAMPPKPPSPKVYVDLDARILICEDSAHNREILQLMLKRMGFRNIDTVSNGADGIRMIDDSTRPYDLLYLDLSMPQVSGYDVIRHIQDNNLWLPKIIVVTASVLQGEQDRCKSMGVNYFLKKPYCSESLKVVTFQSLSSIGKRA